MNELLWIGTKFCWTLNSSWDLKLCQIWFINYWLHCDISSQIGLPQTKKVKLEDAIENQEERTEEFDTYSIFLYAIRSVHSENLFQYLLVSKPARRCARRTHISIGPYTQSMYKRPACPWWNSLIRCRTIIWILVLLTTKAVATSLQANEIQ